MVAVGPEVAPPEGRSWRNAAVPKTSMASQKPTRVSEKFLDRFPQEQSWQRIMCCLCLLWGPVSFGAWLLLVPGGAHRGTGAPGRGGREEGSCAWALQMIEKTLISSLFWVLPEDWGGAACPYPWPAAPVLPACWWPLRKMGYGCVGQVSPFSVVQGNDSSLYFPFLKMPCVWPKALSPVGVMPSAHGTSDSHAVPGLCVQCPVFRATAGLGEICVQAFSGNPILWAWVSIVTASV